jgi:hypothetical protein
MAKVPERFEPVGFHFLPIPGRTGKWGPSWVFDFESQETFSVTPLSIEVSFAGEVRASNSAALDAQIRASR